LSKCEEKQLSKKMPAIEIKNFSKSYGDVQAVKSIDLTINEGELFGLIGPDGAGKTTLMRSVCTLLLPDDGSIHVNGMDVTNHVAEIRSILGYMPQRFSLYQDLSVEQNLQFFADIFSVPIEEREERLKELFHFSQLEPFKKRAAGALSGGMKQKLALSCALIHTPNILVLDEPTFGVDPVSRQEFWEILHAIQKEEKTIFVSTAYMDEADQCDNVALMSGGKIVNCDTPDRLKESFRFPVYKLEGENLRQINEFFKAQPNVLNTQLFGESIHVNFKQSPTEDEWESWKKETNQGLKNWQKITPSIEDIFLNVDENAE
jgi:ABC-2 type transport system ATP-binding protein